MQISNFLSLRPRYIGSAFLLTSALLLSGCGNMMPTASNENLSSQAGTIQGKVHGGQFPVYNSVVRLYAAGTTGYGTGSTLLATSANTDTGGNFSFTKLATTGGVINAALPTWQCPATGNPQIYVTAVGGNTQGTDTTSTNNAAAAFLVALGPCNGVTSSTQVILNELSTAATVYALDNYIFPGTSAGTETIGTSSSSQGSVGLGNAVASIANLTNVSAGSTNSITPPTYTGSTSTVSGVTITATADAPKLVTIANILAACVNTPAASSTQCADLFANATAPTPSTTSQPGATFSAAADTIQAAYYLATNPGLNGSFTSCTTTPAATTKAGCLFALTSGTSPFQTGMTSAPTDYSMNVLYTASGTCSNGYAFIFGPYHAAVDASGNIWFINGGGANTNLSEMSPTGQPLLCIGNLSNGRGLNIDVNGNVWASFNGVVASGTTVSGIQELPVGTSTLVPWPVAAGVQTYELASDGFGNMFLNLNASGGSVVEWVNAANTSTPFTPVQIAGPFNGTATTTQGYMQVDTKGRIWDATSTISDLIGIYPTAASQAAISSITTNGTVATFTTAAGPWASSAGNTVQISGLTSATGRNFNYGTYTILTSPAPTSTSFSVSSTVAATTATDSGTASLPGLSGAGTGTSSYAFMLNTVPNSAYGMSIDSSGNLYQGTTCCGSAAPYRTPIKWYPAASANSGSATIANGTTTNFAGTNGTRALVVDGAANVFVGNEYPNGPLATSSTQTETTTGNWSISEYTTSGTSASTTFTPLSPSGATPPSCTTSAGCATLGGYFDSLGTTTATTSPNKLTGLPFDMQVDPSGNLWVVESGDATTTTNGQAIGEIVGIAVPVVTPLSVALKNGQLGTKP